MMDLSNLPPAPWFERPEKHDDWGMIRDANNEPVMDVASPWHWVLKDCGKPDGPEPIPTIRAFVVLARNAFEIMVQRRWFPRFGGTFDGVDRWKAFSWVALRDVDEIHPYLVNTEPIAQEWHGDPFTAIIEADAWYRKNVEAKPAI